MDYLKFQQPDSYYRPAPFWAINERLTPAETGRQMADMLSVGLSGGFFHSRAGLVTDYLSEEWFAAMEAALKVAREEDGYLWLYDEDLWPSGNAGGQVAGMKDEYRSAGLFAVLLAAGEAPEADTSESILRAAYRVERDGIRLTACAAITPEEARAETDCERLVLYRRYAAKTGWWSGESYSNLLHPEVTEQFLKLTHDVYFEKLGAEFGKRIPGIFTDEPQVYLAPNALPWYEGLPDLYAAWMGRDFWADLPYLFFDGDDARAARLLIHRTVLRQFCEAYSKPIFEWCEAHHIAHTGHYNAEDTLPSQIRYHCGGVMAHYRYQQIPGIDHLCRDRTAWHLLTCKQVGSAARQLGRKEVLTEIFGVSRHTNTFEEFRWIANYDLVLGATFLCPHLTLYTARGRRKRDYPPNWNYQQTYWTELKPLNDYFTRLGWLMTQGEPQVDIVVLHPVESGAAGHRLAVDSTLALPGEDYGAAERCDAMLRRTLEAILNAGYECDLGDETFLEEMGAVEDGRLRIGAVSYAVVVVPPSATWRPSTLALLRAFAQAGGTLLFIGELPTEVDCVPDAEAWRALAAGARIVPGGRPQIAAAIEKIAPRRFRLRDPEGQVVPATFVQHRADDEDEVFFIVNADDRATREYEFLLDSGKPLAVWDPLTGERHAVPGTRYRFTLAPAGSLVLVAGPHAADGAPPVTVPPALDGDSLLLPDTWEFVRSEPNVLVMDRLDVSTDGGKTWWGEDLEFRQRRKLAQHFGIADALQWQPWVAIRKGLFDGKGGEVLLRYRVRSTLNHPTAALVMEDLRRATALTVNGKSVDISALDWHWDRGFDKVAIGAYLTAGENVIVARMPYDFRTEIEAAYLVGDFGVRLANPYAGELISEPVHLTNGSWLEQGYPFYSGNITYRTTITAPEGRAFLRLKQASGILYHVRVNGVEVGPILWRPHVVELTDALRPGENALEIEVVSSRQNTLGPLHEKDGDDNAWVGPGAFESAWTTRDELSLYDYGLLGGAEIVVV